MPYTDPDWPGMEFIDHEEGREMVNKRTMKAYGITAEEFVTRVQRGEMAGCDHAFVTMLLPFMGYNTDGTKQKSTK